MEKFIEAYMQTLQAGVIGVAAAVTFVALGLIIIVVLMIMDNRRRETRHDAQIALYQGMTGTLNQVAASITPISSAMTAMSNIQQNTLQDHRHIVEKINNLGDDTKTRIQAIIESQKAISGKLDILPNSLVAILDAKLTNMEATLISAKNVLSTIKSESKELPSEAGS